MNKNSNIYIILYSTLLVVVVAAVLAYASTSLKDRQQANILIEKKSAILAAIGAGQDAASAPEGKDKYIDDLYDKLITASFFVNAKGERTDVDAKTALDALGNLPEVFTKKEAMPVFEAKKADGSVLYVVPVYGKGLWGPVWGYIGMGEDGNTISGAVFDHKGETPGLGAEISLPAFSDQFAGKTIFDNGKFVSVTLTKGVGSSKGNPHAVDAISGGTLTSNGVRDMLKSCLADYAPFFWAKQTGGTTTPPEQECNGCGNGKHDCTSCGDGEHDCTSCGDGEHDCTSCGDDKHDCTSCGDGKHDCTSCGDGKHDCTSCGDGKHDCTSCSDGEHKSKNAGKHDYETHKGSTK